MCGGDIYVHCILTVLYVSYISKTEVIQFQIGRVESRLHLYLGIINSYGRGVNVDCPIPISVQFR